MLLLKLLTVTVLLAGVLVQGAITKLNAARMTLYGKPNHYKKLVARLDKVLPNVSVKKVLEDTNHKTNLYPLDPHWSEGVTWAKRPGYNDQDTKKWIPQGITSSYDAYQDGVYQGKKAIFTSWYDASTAKAKDPKNKGVRISFIDTTSSNSNNWTYRNVLLVVPHETKGGHISYHPVRIHAGGIMWYGNLLYVVDTSEGIRIFDLDHIYRVDTGSRIGRVRKGKYTAANYKYIIPQMGHYVAKSATAKGFRFSFISLDRTSKPDSFIVGEYDETGKQNRIARFQLDYRTRLPIHTKGTMTTVAKQFYNIHLKSMQGALSVKSLGTQRYYFTQSHGDGPNGQGDLWIWTVGERFEPFEGVLSRGPEDLTWRDGQVWTLGEHAGDRPVYGISEGSLPP
ncbi:hypothetical protein BJV82DRAFT_563903 [Fennellomyces sp. T-0311]|nr:hypothetical protein BJV82DRAFT_563903 [Fennellomyces sp. T-0311]